MEGGRDGVSPDVDSDLSPRKIQHLRGAPAYQENNWPRAPSSSPPPPPPHPPHPPPPPPSSIRRWNANGCRSCQNRQGPTLSDPTMVYCRWWPERNGIEALRKIDERFNRRRSADSAYFSRPPRVRYTGARLAAGVIKL